MPRYGDFRGLNALCGTDTPPLESKHLSHYAEDLIMRAADRHIRSRLLLNSALENTSFFGDSPQDMECLSALKKNRDFKMLWLEWSKLSSGESLPVICQVLDEVVRGFKDSKPQFLVVLHFIGVEWLTETDETLQLILPSIDRISLCSISRLPVSAYPRLITLFSGMQELDLNIERISDSYRSVKAAEAIFRELRLKFLRITIELPFDDKCWSCLDKLAPVFPEAKHLERLDIMAESWDASVLCKSIIPFLGQVKSLKELSFSQDWNWQFKPEIDSPLDSKESYWTKENLIRDPIHFKMSGRADFRRNAVKIERIMLEVTRYFPIEELDFLLIPIIEDSNDYYECIQEIFKHESIRKNEVLRAFSGNDHKKTWKYIVSKAILTSISKSYYPSLRNLTIDVQSDSMYLFFEAINNFPDLECLEIIFTESFKEKLTETEVFFKVFLLNLISEVLPKSNITKLTIRGNHYPVDMDKIMKLLLANNADHFLKSLILDFKTPIEKPLKKMILSYLAKNTVLETFGMNQLISLDAESDVSEICDLFLANKTLTCIPGEYTYNSPTWFKMVSNFLLTNNTDIVSLIIPQCTSSRAGYTDYLKAISRNREMYHQNQMLYLLYLFKIHGKKRSPDMFDVNLIHEVLKFVSL